MIFAQVCEAGLHISLGIGLRLFKMLEHEVQLLDLDLACQTEDAHRTAAERGVVALLKDAQTLESTSYALLEKADHHQEVIEWFTASADPTDETAPIDEELAQLRTLTQEMYKSAKAKVINYTAL